jgi:HEAT repeat protein
MADVLAARDAGRLTSFARTFKAAARAVVLYPDGHPAITATLHRLAQVTGTSALTAPLRITVTADTLLLDNAAATKPDASIGELAAQLHSHLIGALSVQPGTDTDSWHQLLRLLGRSGAEIREGGGIARLWSAWERSAFIEIAEIDYAEVLRERDRGLPASWQQVVAQCLAGQSALDIPHDLLDTILAAVERDETFARMFASLTAAVADSGGDIGAQAAAVGRLLDAIVSAVHEAAPEQAGTVVRDLAIAVGRLTPEILLSLVRRPAEPEIGTVDAVARVLAAIPDGTIASFVAEHAVGDSAALDRVAQAFQALVVDRDRRERLVTMARDTAIVSGAGGEAFERSWQAIAERLLSQYSDEPFVSGQYARELAGATTQAVQLEHAHDDPPERIAAWLASVSTSELRHLDVLLVCDLLRLEDDLERRTSLTDPVVALIDDLLLVGDIDAAADIVALLASDLEPAVADRRRALARATLDRLVTPTTLQHLLVHLATLDDAAFARVRMLCMTMGERLIAPLAEALTHEERPRIRERLTAILMTFGAAGRREADQLRTSPSADVRRTAIHLLREFGGGEAIPYLMNLLHDPEPAVQRDAVRALLATGAPDALAMLQQAIADGPHTTRQAIVQALASGRDERGTPLAAHIVDHVSHRGELGWMYARAVEILGQLRDPRAIPSLRNALYRGEWWAPRRNATLRRAAALALTRLAAPEATEVLLEAAAHGPRGVRRAAAAALARASDRAAAGDDR